MDIKLIKDPVDNIYDFGIENGDLTLDDSFDTALTLSLFTDARADGGEVGPPQLRRGWWGDETLPDPTDKFGSKNWLLSQARVTNDTLNRGINSSKQALEWLVKNNYSERVNVSGQIIGNDRINLTITLINNNNIVASRNYTLWQNT